MSVCTFSPGVVSLLPSGTQRDLCVIDLVRPCWNGGAMLTSCPNCRQLLELPLQQHQQRALTAMAGGGLVSCAKDQPQPSPSTPVTFTWAPVALWAGPVAPASTPPALAPPPPIPPRPVQPQVAASSDVDLARLAATQAALRSSGWYYEGLSWQRSAELLRNSEPGTFLLRDSSDPRFLFSLSVQTERGPTSVRLHYVAGQFRLDAEAALAPSMPLFNCVVALVQHYVAETASREKVPPHTGKRQVWVDAQGQMYSPIMLTRPLYRRGQPPSLQHWSRLAVNRALGARNIDALQPLPATLRRYLTDYPYVQ